MMRLSCCIAALWLALAPLTASAQAVTNADVLEWPLGDQHLMASSMVLMLGHVVALSNEAQGECILNWYFEDQTKAGAQILRGISDYPDNQPSSIVIALAKRACGEISAP